MARSYDMVTMNANLLMVMVKLQLSFGLSLKGRGTLKGGVCQKIHRNGYHDIHCPPSLICGGFIASVTASAISLTPLDISDALNQDLAQAACKPPRFQLLLHCSESECAGVMCDLCPQCHI